ncbi:sortase [Neobacillus sp. Marseille-QA0830]
MNWKLKMILSLLIVLIGIRAYFFYSDWTKGQTRKEAEQIFQKTVQANQKKEPLQTIRQTIKPPKLSKNGATILGKVEIDALGLSYVILDGASEKNLAISITKVTGPDIHQQGNLVLAGHNMRDGSLFGKLRNLKINDSIRLEDLNGITKEYIIYKKEMVEPTNLSPLNQDLDTNPTVTLITCNASGEKRVIFYAKLKI